MLGFIILVTFWVTGERLIVAPVQSLADRLVRFGRGETAEAPTARTLITELQPLVTAFEAMAGELTRRESALRNANHRLNSLASLDPLTGIANRRSFDAALALQWNTVSQLAVLMIDIDKFKTFNDLYGHKEGDGCIRLVAQTMASTLRGTDLLARLGGEEFAVLMPSASLRAATEAAQRLRRAVETVAIPHRGGPAGVVTVSIGCAACRAGAGADLERPHGCRRQGALRGQGRRPQRGAGRGRRGAEPRQHPAGADLAQPRSGRLTGRETWCLVPRHRPVRAEIPQDICLPRSLT